jgi:TRAP-type C4-dicarboxylate transport system substrate-binding protein
MIASCAIFKISQVIEPRIVRCSVLFSKPSALCGDLCILHGLLRPCFQKDRKGGKGDDKACQRCEGKVEVQATGGEPLEVYAPQYFFFNTPYVMKNFDHLMRVWDGRLGDEARALVAKKGNMKYLGIVYRGLRQMTSNKPIYTPEDVSMLKLRLPGVPNWIAVWKEIGATPVPVPLTGLYDSLKTGKAEASEGDLPQISSFKLNEVQSYLTITNHMVQAGQVLINKGFFDGLSKKDQGLVLKTSKGAIDWANEKIKKGETKILIDLQRKGMQVVIPDADLFREKREPAVEALFRTEWPVTTWKEVLAQ